MSIVPNSACLLCRHAPSSRLQPSSAAMQSMEAPQRSRARSGCCRAPCSWHRGTGCRSLPCWLQGCLKGWAPVWDIIVISGRDDPGGYRVSKSFPCPVIAFDLIRASMHTYRHTGKRRIAFLLLTRCLKN